MKYTKEDLIKALDEVAEELGLNEEETTETKEEKVEKADEKKAEVKEEKKEEVVVEKAKKEEKKAKEEHEEEETEEEEEEEEKAKKKMKKADSAEYDELKKSFDTQGEVLKKALDAVEKLQKSVEDLKTVPTVKKSVDGLEVIQKGNVETDEQTNGNEDTIKKALGKLTKSQVADIMYTDLLEKGVAGVSARDVCEYEATGYISNKDVLEKVLGAVNTRIKNGLL